MAITTKREKWLAVNISNETVSVGFLKAHAMRPGMDTDLLIDTNREAIGQSTHLLYLLRNRKIIIRKYIDDVLVDTLDHTSSPNELIPPSGNLQEQINAIASAVSPTNTIFVGPDAAFTSIADALDSLVGIASETNRWLVKILPGIYNETRVCTVPSFVFVIGDHIDATIVRATGNHHVFVLGNRTGLQNLTVENAPSGYTGIYAEDVGNFALCHKVTVRDCDTGVKCVATSGDSVLFLEYVDFSDCTTNSIKVYTSGQYAFLNAENLYLEYTSGNPADAILIDGGVCNVQGAEGIGFSEVGNCFRISNGGYLNISSARIEEWAKAFYVDGSTGSPYLQINATDIDECTKSVQVDNATAIGHIAGYVDYDTISINSSSGFFVSGQFPNTLTVGTKGCQFTSIKDAMDAIGTTFPASSSTVRYVINVDAGTFTEDTITLKTYVTIQGAAEQATALVLKNSPSYPYMFDNDDKRGAGLYDLVFVNTSTAVKYRGNSLKIKDCRFREGVDSVVDATNLLPSTSLNFLVLEGCSSPASTTLQNIFDLYTNNSNTQPIKLVINNWSTLAPMKTVGKIGVTGGTAGTIHADISDCHFHGDGTGNGLEIASGTNVHMVGCMFHNFIKSVYVSGSNGSPYIDMSGVSFADDTVVNLQIDNPTASGYFSGYSYHTKTFINSANTFFITDKDEKVITVRKKGGDYDSIKDAVSSIGDAAIDNRYVVSVGPGVFTEDTIFMKDYVAVIGTELKSTIVELKATPTTPDLFVFENDIQFSSVRDMLIRNAPDGALIKYRGGIVGIENVRFYGTGQVCIDAYGVDGALVENSLSIINCSTAIVYSVPLVLTVGDDGTHKLKVAVHGFYTSVTPGGIPGFAEVGIASGAVHGDHTVAYFLSCCVEGNGTGDAFVVGDGSDFHLVGNIAMDFDNGIYIQNVGNPPEVEAVNNLVYDSASWDVLVDHPTATGVIGVTCNKDKVSIASSNISAFIQGTEDGSLVLSGDFYQGETFAAATNLTSALDHVQPTGVVFGGELTRIAGAGNELKVAVAAGEGYLYETDPKTDSIKNVPWTSQQIDIPNVDGNHYIYIDINANATSTENIVPYLTAISLGRAIVSGGAILLLSFTPREISSASTRYDKIFRNYLGCIYGSGSTVTANGLKLNVTGGTYTFSVNEFAPAGATPITFSTWYRDPNNPGDYVVATGVQNVDTNFYDSEGVGLVELSSNSKFAKHLLFIYGGSDTEPEQYFFLYGEKEFDSAGAAEVGELPIIPEVFTRSITSIASIVVQHQAVPSSILAIYDERPTLIVKTGSATTSTSDHLLLSSLTPASPADAGHTQFVMRDGSKAMTNNFNMGTHNITNVGTVDGVDVSGHAARHLPNSGTDALTTAAPNSNLTSTSTNSEGAQPSFARSDHTHAITAYSDGTVGGLVKLDGSGNLTANVITANLTGNVTGNVSGTAATFTGNLTGNVTSTGMATTIASNVITNAMINASAGIVDTKLATISTTGKVSNSATTAASANTASAIVARDSLGDFSATTITANLTGDVTGNVSGTAATFTGNLTGNVTSTGMSTTIASNVITNAMINASAGIVDTKLATISTTGKVSNSATTAASTNTASAIVARDGSGNFSAGMITANLTGNVTGNADTVTTNANLTGNVTSVGNATTIASNVITNAMINASAGIVDTKLATISTAGKVSNSATTATSSDTASAIVARDNTGNFSAGTITANLTGDVTGNTSGTASSFTGSLVGDVTGTQGATVVSTVGTSSAANIHSAELAANAATNANTASTIVKRDGSGNFSAGTITASLTGNASGSAGSFTGSLVGDVTGTQGATVVSTVGTSSAANVHSAELAASAATNANTVSTIVKRDGSGNFSAGTITANLTGNASGTSANVTGVVAIANGGTNSSSSLNNNRVIISSGGAIGEASAITVNRALVSNASGIPIAATTTATEIGYVNGVTSAIQTQLGNKAAASDLTNHTDSTSNPHSTTIGQAIAAGNSMSGSIDAGTTYTITNLPDPTNPGDACNKHYADATAAGINPKDACRVATTGALTANYTGTPTFTLESTSNATLVIDTVSVSVTDRVLVKDQADSTQNGIYVVTNVGASGGGGHHWVLTRASDFNASGEITNGTYTLVTGGAAYPTGNAKTGWILTTTPPITLDGVGLTFSLFSIVSNIDPGVGLALNVTAFDVQTDGSTTGINGSNQVYVKANGITTTQLASNIPLDTFTSPSGDISMGTHKITNLAAPVNPNDAARNTDVGAVNTALNNHIGTGGTAHAVATSSVAGFLAAADKTKLDNATASNTISTLVLRNSSGNFSAGTITANLTGDVTGNTSGSAGSFTGSLVGDVTGTQGATVVSTVGTSSAANVHSAELAANAATNANTASTIVKRDGSGNFSAGTITASLTGNASGSAGSFTGSLVGDVTGTQGATVVSTVGTSSAANVHSAELAANAATNLNTISTIVKRDSSGNFSAGTITANLTGDASGSAASFTGSLVGDVTGTQGATVVSTVGTSSAANIHSAELAANAATNANTASTIVKRDISGNFSAGTITANLTGNASGSAGSFTGSLVGDVTGTQGATVVSTVGTSSAANVHSAELAANAATNANTVSTIVKRDSSGNFSAGTITASLTGGVTGNVSGSAGSFTGSLVGDVTGTQGATVVSTVGTSSASNIHSAELVANAATNANTVSTIVKRDSSGNFSAGTITANLTGNASGSAATFTGNLTGNVTSTGMATTIANNVVTNAMLAQMSANTIKGNNTGGAANAADLTAAQTAAILPAVVGDSGSGGTKGLVPAPATGDAAAGKFLKADGTWTAPPGAAATGYGVIYLNAASATTTSGNNAWAKITAFDTNGLSSNTTVDATVNRQITVTNTGIYEITISGSASWAGNGVVMIFGVSVGGASPATNAQVRQANPTNTTQIQGIRLSALMSLSAGNVLTLAANGPAGAITVTYYTGFSISVKRIA